MRSASLLLAWCLALRAVAALKVREFEAAAATQIAATGKQDPATASTDVSAATDADADPTTTVFTPSGHWPLTLKGDHVWHPQPQWRPDAEDPTWNRQQRKWRKPQKEGSVLWHKSVEKVFSDDKAGEDEATDSHFWKDLGGMTQDNSEYWKSICDGAIPKDTDKKESPFAGWEVKNDTTCDPKQMIEGEITDEMEAYKKCGADCASVVDMGCNRTKFRLCKLGSLDVKASGTCLIPRFPNHRAPESKPAKPMETEFWKTFCAEGNAKFRRLFKGKLCAVGKALDVVYSEGGCADKAAADADCSDIFDFQEGTPPVCRCVAKGAECAAAPPTTSTGLFTGVFTLIRDPAVS